MTAPRELLRLATAGSFDDGKSTLIGRLLLDTKLLLADQLAASRATARRPDLAALTDGLRAEREQGITIDVAYRYFATPRRTFILADTPGHERYTRNMFTGASNADLAIVLVDARAGVVVQTRRHVHISSLLGIRHVVAEVNKMDLVGFSQERFDEVAREVRTLTERLGIADVQVIPISALDGDSVVARSERMPWYDGPAARGARDRRRRRRPRHRPPAPADPVARARRTAAAASTPGRWPRVPCAPATRSWCCRPGRRPPSSRSTRSTTRRPTRSRRCHWA